MHGNKGKSAQELTTVRKALDEAVQQPGPAMLMEAESPRYGTSEEIRLDIPRKDIAFLKDLASRMGWKIN